MSITGATDLGDGLLALTVDHDPLTVATDAPLGSVIITSGGIWYRKLDNGSSTNVARMVAAGLWANKVSLWTAFGNVTTVSVLGFGTSNTGTATARTVATTNFSTQLRRVAFVSAAVAGSSCGTRHNAAQFYTGNGAGRGGFFYVARFVIDTVQADMRWFVGLLNAAAVIGNVNPSTLTNMVGFGIDSAQTTVQFFNNDGAGAATATDLGASFPATTAGVVYETRLFCAPNTTTIYYSIERLDVAAFTENNVTTDIPSNTTLLSPQIWANNGTTAAAVAVAVVTQYMETDN